MTMLKISLLLICFLYAIHTCGAYKVLVVFPLLVKSHSFLGEGIAKHLVEAGHEVTYITPYPSAAKRHTLLREIYVSSMHDLLRDNENTMNIEKLMKKEKDTVSIPSLIRVFFEASEKLFKDENVTKLLNDPKEQFDVVILDWMYNELVSGIAAIFNCPYIWVSTIDPHWLVLRIIDELPNPAYLGDFSSGHVVPFSFTKRAYELFKLVTGLSVEYYYSGNNHADFERLLVPFIKKRGHPVPDFEELRYNASLMLGNSHVSMGSAIRLPQNYKAIAGYHIDNNVKPLPEDLKKLLDNANNGLIYFSMGSNLCSQHLPAAVKAALLKMFGKLKQTVLWKFEEDLPNRPSNVHIVQWAPQQSILAHPNCVLFITHGGLLSITETIHFGKPVIGIPVYADQFSNVDRIVKKGFAKRVLLSYNMAQEIGEAIKEMIEDPSYAAKAKEFSMIYHDRPVPPGKELVHWVEHVVRTRGAPHLRSPALLLPWYQKIYLDLALLVILIMYILRFIVNKIIRTIFFSKLQKEKKQ